MAKEEGKERKERKARKERGFFGKMIVFILAVLAFLGLVAMAMSVANAYIDPKDFIWTTAFALAFWEIFFFNVAVFLLLLLMWSNKVWISVVALLIAIPGLSKSLAIGSQSKAENSIRVMSYNVHMFDHIDGKTENEQCAKEVLEMVCEQCPDILCCQEFTWYKKGVSRTQCIQDFADDAGFQYIYYNRKNGYGGNVIFSKYPMAKVTEDSGFGKENTYGVMVSVDAGDKGKFHLANVHLLSYMITDSEIDVLTNTTERQDNLDTIGKKVLHKLKYAFQRRSEELQTVLNGMPPIEGPVIVCGDFNETPMSYNYRQMQKAGYVDTFTKVGHGIKPTYAGKLPLMRIDYVWAKDGVKPLRFKRHKIKVSDHYPIMLDFKIEN